MESVSYAVIEIQHQYQILENSFCNIKKASEQPLYVWSVIPFSVILFSKHHTTKQHHAITATLNAKFHTAVIY